MLFLSSLGHHFFNGCPHTLNGIDIALFSRFVCEWHEGKHLFRFKHNCTDERDERRAYFHVNRKVAELPITLTHLSRFLMKL